MSRRGESAESSAASAGEALELRGQAYKTSGDVIAYLESVESDEDRYSAQTEVLEAMVAYCDRAGDMIEEVFKYVEADGAFRAAVSHEEFNQTWEGVRLIVQSNKDRRNRLGEASRAVEGRWDARAVEWLGRTHSSASFMQAVRMLAGACTLDEGARRVNRAVVERLRAPRKGISAQRAVQTADFTAARGMEAPEGVTRAELRVFGLRIGDAGFVEAGEVRELAGADTDCEGGVPHFPGPAREMGPLQDGGSERPQLRSTSEEDFVIGFRDEQIDEDLLDEVSEELRELDDAAGASEGSDAGADSLKGARRSACGCSSDVTSGWKTTVAKSRSFSMASNMKLLRRMRGFQRVCYAHAKAMGGHMGLRVKKLSGPQLDERLQLLHDSRLRIGKLKTDAATFSWFRVKNRPHRPSDLLGPYKFMHAKPPAEFDYDQKALLAWIDGSAAETWEREGSVNVDLFGWWFDTAIGRIVLAEYDMYRHHLREVNGKGNYGWLRNMFYSIGQQLMRQDPMYYALYAALRPDRQWRLVTYPYYAKFAVEGDNTYFRHIDLNVPDLVASSRGSNMIQGSVSLDDEDPASCTVILPGMQHKLKEWWERVVERGQETDGFVHRITGQMFTREDAAVLGVDWKRVPCQRGQVRVTLPHLPHGADGPSTRTRRTMLPWFVGLQDDLATLELVESGTWEMLSAAHRDLVAPQATPSGLGNRYGPIPYKFPAAVEVVGLGALSDALVCRRRWDSGLVLRDRDIMLSGDWEAATAYVRECRQRAEAAAVEAFEVLVRDEKRLFGEKSYFYHLERKQHLGIPIPTIEPDEEAAVDDEEGGEAEGREAEVDFAEAAMDE